MPASRQTRRAIRSRDLLKHFGTTTLEGFGIEDNDGVIRPAGAVIEYLNETQKTTLGHIRNLRKVNRKKFLQIDTTSLRSLEILQTIRTESTKGTLLDCLDETLTGMGGRMIRNWLCMPLCDLGAIELRQDAVEEMKDTDAGLADTGQLPEIWWPLQLHCGEYRCCGKFCSNSAPICLYGSPANATVWTN